MPRSLRRSHGRRRYLMHRFRLTEQLGRPGVDAGDAGAGCRIRFFPRRNLSSALPLTSDGSARWRATRTIANASSSARCSSFTLSCAVKCSNAFRIAIQAALEDYDLVREQGRQKSSASFLECAPWRRSRAAVSTGAAYRLEQFWRRLSRTIRPATSCRRRSVAPGLRRRARTLSLACRRGTNADPYRRAPPRRQ